jgi:hypothetical protein
MLTEDSAGWSGRENLHTIRGYGHPLAVTCECSRKLAIPLHRLGRLDGNMAPIKSLRLVCRSLWLEELEGDAFRERAGGRGVLGRTAVWRPSSVTHIECGSCAGTTSTHPCCMA